MKRLQLDYSDMKRISFEAILLVCLGISLGLMFNFDMVRDAFEGNVVTTAAAPDENQAEIYPVPVTLADLKELAARSVLVDARISELYREGHLPGAISMPLGDAEKQLDDFKKRYANRSLVVYCSGYGCSDSFDLAMRLIAGGFHDVMVFEGGFPEWHDAGLPIEKGAP